MPFSATPSTSKTVSFNCKPQVITFEVHVEHPSIDPFSRGKPRYHSKLKPSARAWSMTEIDKWIIEAQSSIDRSNRKARNKAFRLGLTARIPLPVLTTFIVDTGAGVHLRCAASGLATSKIKKLTLQRANGLVETDCKTRVKFRRLGYHDCLVLENTPNVLSVGQLIKLGYSFHWTPGTISKETMDSDEFPSDMSKMSNESSLLVTPKGSAI
jgi:hypothetical protein